MIDDFIVYVKENHKCNDISVNSLSILCDENWIYLFCLYNSFVKPSKKT